MFLTRDPQTLTLNERSALFTQKMRVAKLPELMVHSFLYYYKQLLAGETGFISSQAAGPVDSIPSAEMLQAYRSAGEAVLDKTVILKLNGGLGTSMGMHGPKSLLQVKNGLTFLDVIVRQTLHLRQTFGARLPLLFMNSFHTQAATQAALNRYRDLTQDVPFGFLQHKEPKIDKETLMPASWPISPEKEWCPPGHGDLYPAIVSSGVLEKLSAAGYEYIFVSNSDNLGATLDLGILGYVAQESTPFLMEVTDRTLADRKGGHLARRQDGQLILREIAQCPPDELELFQDIERYRYFNTNSLWIHLPTLKRVVEKRNGILGLPLIRNEKPVDPTDNASPRVYQLETAMGSAIAVFEGAQAMRVSRERFVPVKKNNDLLLLRSDVYELNDQYELVQTVEPLPLVDLDMRYYQLLDELEARFPHGAPSLKQCSHLEVVGDVHFGKNVVVKGDAKVINDDQEALYIGDQAVVSGLIDI